MDTTTPIQDSRQTLMIVDDDRASLNVLSELFVDKYRVRIADNGIDALDIAHHADLDLILLDVQMPGMDGYETCKELKHCPETEHTPIIFVSGHEEHDQEMIGLGLGAIDYVTKPFNFRLLQIRVKNQMELSRYRKELETASQIDGLTGVANRAQLNKRLDNDWQLALRRKEPLAVIMIDIDDFKQYNDTYGHLAGDDCLRRVAQAIASYPRRPNDLVGRYGGEEFIVLLPNTDKEGARIVATSIQRAIRSQNVQPVEGQAHNCPVTVSIGVASHLPRWVQGQPDKMVEGLINEADTNLYRAKRLGKNQICETLADLTH